MIAAAWNGRMYVMGGITEKGVVASDVDIYDPSTNIWTKGPALPGTGVSAFAPAATVHNGGLYVSVADGTLYRLNESMQRWDETGRATGRVAHRLVSDGKVILVMGGAADGKDFALIEAITPASPSAQ
jgi:outer membrane protein assembly factor BamB